MGAHDPVGRLKVMLAARTSNASWGLHGMHLLQADQGLLPSTVPPRSFSLPYPIHMEVFNGSAWDAAQVYRQWVLANAVWTQSGNLTTRLRQGRGPSPWTLTTPLWVVYHGDFADASPSNATIELMAFKQLLSGLANTSVPFATHWYDWNTEPFDTWYPVYTPQPGLAEAIARLQSAGLPVVPYTNGRLFGL